MWHENCSITFLTKLMTKKILVVDDIGEYASVFEMYFPDDAVCLGAKSVEEAKAVFAEHAGRGAISLAIVDVRLNEGVVSDSSGMGLLSWIRERHPGTPVIMMSAYQGFEYEMEALERGAFCFLRKPLQPEVVKDALRRALAA